MRNPENSIVEKIYFDLDFMFNKHIIIELDNIPDNAIPLKVSLNNTNVVLTILYKQNLIVKPTKRNVYLVKTFEEFNANNLIYLGDALQNIHFFVDYEFMTANRKDFNEQ